MELYKMPAHKLNQMLRKKEISAVELAKSVFSRIKRVEPEVKSYITLTEKNALLKAEEVDKKISVNKSISLLAGIPTAIKDNMCTKNILTTCASKILSNYIPIFNSTAVKKIMDEDIVMTGKTNMDEFAMGSSTENSAFGTTRNPWDLETVPGGSSGGSAAAVAAGEAILALGSDTGGSIRQPASFCGVVGMKPTYGLVSRYGLVAFASSLDQIGPITKDVTDCALILNHIIGYDKNDNTSIKVKIPDYTQALTGEINEMKIGLISDLMGEGIQPEVQEAVSNSVKIFSKLGAIVEEVSLKYTEYCLPTYYIIAPSEASSNLARYDGVRYGYRIKGSHDILEMYKKSRSQGFGTEVKRRIMLGTFALSAGYYEAYYGQAQKLRTLIVEDFSRAFSQFDVLISPTSPTVAFKIGEKIEDPLQMYLSDICTIPVNLAGLPAISIPCGVSQGLPIGLQIIGKALNEMNVLKAAFAFEKEFGFKKSPPL